MIALLEVHLMHRFQTFHKVNAFLFSDNILRCKQYFNYKQL